MDNEQARLILSAYRHTGEDASDPIFAEALEQARVDPELAAWFAGERRFDEAMTRLLGAQHPPEDLRQTLMLGNKVVSLHQRRPLWARPISWLAVAAALVLLLGLVSQLRQGPQPALTGPQYAQEIIELAGAITLGKFSDSADDLKSWLHTHGSPHDFAIPPRLRGYAAIGCQTYSVHGAKVSLICFMVGKDQVAHLFVVDASELRDAPGKSPAIVRDRGQVAATWSAGGKTYLLIGTNVSEEALRRLI